MGRMQGHSQDQAKSQQSRSSPPLSIPSLTASVVVSPMLPPTDQPEDPINSSPNYHFSFSPGQLKKMVKSLRAREFNCEKKALHRGINQRLFDFAPHRSWKELELPQIKSPLRLLLIASLSPLPGADAAPTGAIPYPNFPPTSNLSYIMAWVTTLLMASIIICLGLRIAAKDPVLSGVLSFFTAVAPVVFADARAVPQIAWPVLIVGLSFLVNFWKKLFDHHAMGIGWIPVILMLAFLLDAMIVRLASGSEPGDQGMFYHLLLICTALSLFACSAIKSFVGQFNFRRSPSYL